MEKATVVKIGGNVVDDPQALREVLQKFAQLQGHKVLVHGGGKIATQIGEKLGVSARMVEGRRITDADTLEVVTMVYGGLANKKIVALLQSMGCNAIGLTGADGNLIPAHKRSGTAIDYGFVGDFEAFHINIALLEKLFQLGISPVVAPLTHDQEGSMLNTNADTIASGLAVALAQDFDTTLVYCFEKKGVLIDINDPDSLIISMDRDSYADYRSKGIIADGMIPKLDNAFNALDAGVAKVRICQASDMVVPESGTSLCL